MTHVLGDGRARVLYGLHRPQLRLARGEARAAARWAACLLCPGEECEAADAVNADKYLLFDFPGQVELYTHEQSVHRILQKLQKLGYKVRTAECDRFDD